MNINNKVHFKIALETAPALDYMMQKKFKDVTRIASSDISALFEM